MLEASGAIEGIFSVLSLRDQVIPPTINVDNSDEAFNLNYLPKDVRQIKGMEITPSATCSALPGPTAR